jgi:error-prone DNA polymerase
MNSLPMGFYSPSQLMQDIRRHGIEVRPIRVEYSDWDHTLEPNGTGHSFALRLGLRLVGGFNPEAAARLIAARRQQPFHSLQDLKERAGLGRLELEALVAADALAQLSGHRPQTQWEAAALAPAAPLLSELERGDKTHLHDAVTRPAPGPCEDMLGDYHSTGLSLKYHPLQLLRQHPRFARCPPAVQLPQLPHGRFVRVAGVVTGRQRPGTAKDIIFMTLEDETGNINVIVKPEVQERCRKALLNSRIALVKGVLERRTGTAHVVAGHIEDVSAVLSEFEQPSRDFH